MIPYSCPLNSFSLTFLECDPEVTKGADPKDHSGGILERIELEVGSLSRFQSGSRLSSVVTYTAPSQIFLWASAFEGKSPNSVNSRNNFLGDAIGKHFEGITSGSRFF